MKSSPLTKTPKEKSWTTLPSTPSTLSSTLKRWPKLSAKQPVGLSGSCRDGSSSGLQGMAGSDRSSGNIRGAGMRCPATDDPDQSARDLAECPPDHLTYVGKDGRRQLPHFCTEVSFHRFTAGTGRRGRGIGGSGLLPATNRLREADKGAKRPNRNGFHPRFGSGRWRPINAAVC
jgi:hypothetical protein